MIIGLSCADAAVVLCSAYSSGSFRFVPAVDPWPVYMNRVTLESNDTLEVTRTSGRTFSLLFSTSNYNRRESKMTASMARSQVLVHMLLSIFCLAAGVLVAIDLSNSTRTTGSSIYPWVALTLSLYTLIAPITAARYVVNTPFRDIFPQMIESIHYQASSFRSFAPATLYARNPLS